MLSLVDSSASGWLYTIVAAIILGRVVSDYSWSVFYKHRAAQHFFFGSIVVLFAFSSMSAGILPGMNFHILGYTAITLMMGWRLAFVVSALVEILLVFTGAIHWQDVGINFVLSAALPILFSYCFFQIIYWRLKHNPFIYILLAGFVNAALTQALHAVVLSAWFGWHEVYAWSKIWDDYCRYLPLMMFPEGVVNGMFITGMVVFHPRWLSTFDEDSYFSS